MYSRKQEFVAGVNPKLDVNVEAFKKAPLKEQKSMLQKELSKKDFYKGKK